MIGKKLYKPVNLDEYSKVAEWCNENNATIEDKGNYYEVVAVVPHEPTLQEQIESLEHKTGYSRAIRELILANDSGASAYVKSKAQEIENIAEQLRGK
ncbi:MAG: hypothetical protein J6S85_10015 [Methanobrevibacter sp.]|nr:hypothetical protein [Methanobrevibacter sp.]